MDIIGESNKPSGPGTWSAAGEPKKPLTMKEHYIQQLKEDLHGFLPTFDSFCRSRLNDLDKFLRETNEIERNAENVTDFYLSDLNEKIESLLDGLLNTFGSKVDRISGNITVDDMWDRLREIYHEQLNTSRTLCFLFMFDTIHEVYGNSVSKDTVLFHELESDLKAIANEEGFCSDGLGDLTIRRMTEFLSKVERNPVFTSHYAQPLLEELKETVICHLGTIVQHAKEVFCYCVSFEATTDFEDMVSSMTEVLIDYFKKILVEISRPNSSLGLMKLLITLHADLDSVFLREFPSLRPYEISETNKI